MFLFVHNHLMDTRLWGGLINHEYDILEVYRDKNRRTRNRIKTSECKGECAVIVLGRVEIIYSREESVIGSTSLS